VSYRSTRASYDVRLVSLARSALAPLALLLVVACDAKTEEAPKTTTKTVYRCKITVAETEGEPETYKGRASGTDEAAVEKEAWDAACAALPEADRAECRNRDAFAWASGGGSSTVDGVETFSRTITLTRVVRPKESEAEVESDASDEAACTEALAKACEAAGAKGDCVAAGTLTQRGRRSSKETKTVPAE
jgi:hypothetical protein